MKRHLAYFRYVFWHKLYVYQACRFCGVSIWQALIHDWHKFLPSEWGPYARTFYKQDGSKQYIEASEFSVAWNLHQKRGKHHWQHWLLTWDRGETEALEMPICYLLEMCADWWGAGRAITGEWKADEWYQANKSKIKLHPNTRAAVEAVLAETRCMIDRSFNLGMPL